MSTRVCPYCGATDYGTHFCLVCQRPLDRTPEADTPAMGSPEPDPVVAAGFFRRLAAIAIDWFILSILGDLFDLVYMAGAKPGAGGMSVDVPSVLTACAFVLYFTLLTGDGGMTLGKALLGIKVQRTDGTPVRYGRAFLRTIGYFVSFFFMTFLGFLWALWDKKKQAWHDKIARTEVIKI